MGFALWVDDDVSWAMGTHEYRPMGVAIIASNGRFRPRDFHPARKTPSRNRLLFAGFFASIEHMNHYLAGRAVGQRRRREKRSRAMEIL